MSIRKRPWKDVNVVIAHDWINGMRGGERVLAALLELFPQAPIYTLFYTPEQVPEIFRKRTIIPHWSNSCSLIQKNYRYFLPFFPLFMETFSIKHPCDILISSNHCLIKGIKVPGDPFHVSYIHSPMRYIYDQFDSYFQSWQRPLAYGIRDFLQTYDRISNNAIDLFLANSSFVQERIKNYYQKDSLVLYPFVDLEDFPQNPREKAQGLDAYYIMVSAMAPNKRLDLAIEAFSSPALSGKKLKIIGDGQLWHSLEALLRKKNAHNIEFLGPLPRKELIDYLARAQALIFPGVEDFGITPLESLASFTPVIAYYAAGVKETLNPRVAKFFHHPSGNALAQAVLEWEEENSSQRFNPWELKNQAMGFSKEKFQTSFLEILQKNYYGGDLQYTQ